MIRRAPTSPSRRSATNGIGIMNIPTMACSSSRACSRRRRPPRERRAAPARRRQPDGGSGRRDREDDRHLERRHPRLGRSRLLDQDRRGPGPAQRDLVPGRPRGRLLRRLLRAVRRPARLHADRRRGGEPRAVRRLGRSRSGGHDAGRAPPRPPRRRPPAAAAAPPTATRRRRPRTGNVTAGAETPATTNQSARPTDKAARQT